MNDFVLEDALEQLIDHRGKTPLKLGSSFAPSGVPVVSAIMVKDGSIDFSNCRFVSPELAHRWMAVPTQRGDVLLTSEAPLGRVARVLSDEPLVLGQRIFGLRGRSGILDSGYLFYALQHRPMQAQLAGLGTGTTVVGIRQSALRRITLALPSMGIQQGAAAALGALDDKVTANLALARTADGLAAALFKRLSGNLSRSCTYEEFAVVGGGGTPSTNRPEYWGGDICWATPTDVTALDAPYLSGTSRQITSEGLANCASPLYPAGSILMTSRATIGAFALTEIPTAVNQGFIVANSKRRGLNMWLFHEMRSRVAEYLAFANGATFLELSRGRFKSLKMLVDTPEAMASFGDQVRPLHDVARRAMIENRTLIELRDTLLPALMSGRLRVKDAERQVEDAV